MKRKLITLLSLVMLLICVSAVSISAEGLVALDSDPGLDCEESQISYFSSVSEPKVLDKTSLAVLTDGTKYYVVPAYYVLSDQATFSPNVDKLNNAIGETKFESLKKSLVRIELPSGTTVISQTSKFEDYTLVREIHFPETLTQITAQNTFTRCTSLEYISDISGMTAIGRSSFSGCSSLAVDIVWPSAVTYMGDEMFSDCKMLKSVTLPQGLKKIDRFAFNNCDSLTEIILPNTVESVGKHAFGSCDNLTTINFGAGFKSFIRWNQDYETTQNDNNLKYVYLPEAFADAVAQATKGDYKTIFNNGKNVTFFYTGSLEKATLAKEKMALTEANETFGNATLVEYNPNVDYTVYADTLGKSIIVYNYNLCEAFYGGEHKMAESETMKFVSYFEPITYVCACENGCGNEIVNESKTISAIFTYRGYSCTEKAINGFHSMTQSYSIDTDALAEYKKINPEFKFGLVASGYANPLDESVDASKVVNYPNEKFAREHFEIKVKGISGDNMEKAVVFCLYVIDNGTYYLDNNTVSENVTGISFNELHAIKYPTEEGEAA